MGRAPRNQSMLKSFEIEKCGPYFTITFLVNCTCSPRLNNLTISFLTSDQCSRVISVTLTQKECTFSHECITVYAITDVSNL